jgi:hypothetical protein
VETLVRGDLDELWRRTQDPAEHVRWDVRFSRITPTGKTDTGATRFSYERRFPLHRVRGVGISLGEVSRPDGTRTSALRFSTTDPLSPIRSGRGYWRYIPAPDGVRFVTGYDYDPGWGVLDIVVRPLLGWATAWSFDRLRLWIETGTPPEQWPLRSVLWWWRADRPRAARCLRAPAGGSRRGDQLAHAPATLRTLADPEPAR